MARLQTKLAALTIGTQNRQGENKLLLELPVKLTDTQGDLLVATLCGVHVVTDTELKFGPRVTKVLIYYYDGAVNSSVSQIKLALFRLTSNEAAYDPAISNSDLCAVLASWFKTTSCKS